MVRPTRFCRVSWIIEDMDALVKQLAELFGLGMRFGSIAIDIIKAGIDEHGLQPMQLYVPAEQLPFMDGIPYPLLEIALGVDDCEATYRRLAADAILPSFTSPLPGPDTREHLYARGFGGIPIMSCTDGDNEAMNARERPFLILEDAPSPKVGVISLLADDIDAAAARFTKYFDMQWVPSDAGGFGARALVGPHRVKLIEAPSAAVQAHAMQTLAAAEMMFDDPAAARVALENAGYPVLAERSFSSGRKCWYFGAVLQGLPLAVFDSRDEAEARGII